MTAVDSNYHMRDRHVPRAGVPEEREAFTFFILVEFFASLGKIPIDMVKLNLCTTLTCTGCIWGPLLLDRSIFQLGDR
jgi:hypothetical protein